MRSSHQDAELRYSKLRNTAIEIAQNLVTSGIRLTTITPVALTAAKKWNNSASRLVDWDWQAGFADFSFRHPKRFDLAVWEGAELISLSMGRPTYEGTHLRLDFAEARPREIGPRIQVFAELLLTYTIYARLLNAKEVRIMHPLNEKLREYYRAFGYTYIDKGDYLFKEIR